MRVEKPLESHHIRILSFLGSLSMFVESFHGTLLFVKRIPRRASH